MLMNYDKDRAAEMVLALMYLTSSKDRSGVVRAWKGLPSEVAEYIFQKGYTSNPMDKTTSVWLTPEGARLSEVAFRKYLAETK
jgi:Domain of unknown function (DUF6429)